MAARSTAGGAYLVGERGPELFRPAVGGAIEPAAAAAGSMSPSMSRARTRPALARSDAQLAQALAPGGEFGRAAAVERPHDRAFL
jgi:phage-related minor tail protein